MSITSTFPTTPTASSDWRLRIAEPRRRALRAWLWSIAGMTFGVLIVGGITRLTQSGLSIVDWDPLMGVIPPLTEPEWQQSFDAYRQYPEYQKLRAGMTLDEYKQIFFWEYVHRLLARAIGLVFLVPFIAFALRGYLTKAFGARALLLFGLGAMQGLMGWLMVASGLVDRPSVSHFRLAAHLSLAFVIFGYAVWLARDLKVRTPGPAGSRASGKAMRRGLTALGVLLAAQIVWGAFVAGLKAGFFANTFPLMAGRLVPRGLITLDPAMLNFVQNPFTVQWTHRVLGTLLLLAVTAFYWRVSRSRVDPFSRNLNTAFASGIAVQYLLGVLTLVLVVPVPLGVTHQAMAMVLFGVWTVWLHHARELERAGDAS